MTEKILITSDSTTDLSPELLAQYQIPILPLTVTLNDIDHKDGLDITPEDIYRNYEENKSLPKTAAPNLADCTEFFRHLFIKSRSHSKILSAADAAALAAACQGRLSKN